MPRRNGTGPFWWRGRFKGCGYRLTIPRKAIVDVLDKANKHLSAEDIYLSAHKVYPAIGLTTIYRTLELLVQMGVVFKFASGDGRARYQLSAGPKAVKYHHQLVCTTCGRVIDYADFIDKEKELFSQTEKGLSEKYNFKILNRLVRFYGLCDECSQQRTVTSHQSQVTSHKSPVTRKI